MRNFQSKGSQLKNEKQNPAIRMLLKQKEIRRCLAWEDRTLGLLAGLKQPTQVPSPPLPAAPAETPAA